MAKSNRTPILRSAAVNSHLSFKWLYMTGQEYGHLNPYYSEDCISLGYLTKEEQLAVMSQADSFVVTSN